MKYDGKGASECANRELRGIALRQQCPSCTTSTTDIPAWRIGGAFLFLWLPFFGNGGSLKVILGSVTGVFFEVGGKNVVGVKADRLCQASE